MYILCSICFLAYLYRRYDGRKHTFSILIFLFLLVFFAVMIWFLGSRAGYLTFIALLLGISMFFMLKTQKLIISFGIIVTGIVASTFFISPQLKNNMNEVVNQIEQKEGLTSESDMRLWIWQLSYEIFEDNYFKGVGTGDISDELDKQYQRYNLAKAEDRSYNAHNQFIETALGLGIPGLSILFLWFAGMFLYALQKKDFVLFFFAIVVSINFMFESMLNTIAGVSFFAYFYVLLLFRKYKKET